MAKSAYDTPGLNVNGLSSWLAAEHPELGGAVTGALSASLLPGGRSNLTYRIDGARVPLVLRRPPLGHVLASAHDMRREYRVMAALGASPVPVPSTVAVVDDTDDARVTGTPFFVMRFVEGTVLTSRVQNDAFTRAALRAVSIRLVEALADLHTLVPDAVGLGDFGHPAGYLKRQLSTWRRQHEASRSRDLPALERLHDVLGERMPSSADRAAIVHGDYRLDNVIIVADGGNPRIAAILDWEMATLGDPLVDLGMLQLYWDIASLPNAVSVMPSSVDPAAGYPDFDELLDAYAARARILTPDLTWYRAFAAYKLAVIAEGIHYRYTSGGTVGAGFERVGALVEPLAEDGLARALAGKD